MVIGCDIDGVIRDFDRIMIMLYNRMVSPGEFVPEHWRPTHYDDMLQGRGPFRKEIIQRVWIDFQSVIFEEAPTYPGSHEFVEELNKLGTVVFITSQHTREAERATLRWIANHKFDASGVLFTPGEEKWRWCDFLIDDKRENLEAAEKHGKVGLAIARPYNYRWDIWPGRRGERGDYDLILTALRQHINRSLRPTPEHAQ